MQFLYGKWIVGGTTDGSCRICEAKTSAEHAWHHLHTKCVGSIVLSPDGRQMASGAEDGSVVMWDLVSEDRVVI